MSEYPKATIVIPLRAQQDAWLEQCVRSALTQTVSTSVVVVTSPHTPNSNLALLKRLLSEHRYLECLRQPGHGFADAINEGWQRARTPRVGLLLSDDWLSPETVEQCLAHDADIVSTGHIGYTADGDRVLWERPCDQAAFEALPTLESKASYLTHFFLFKRDAVLAVGGVDPEVGDVGPDDYDLPWTLLEQGASVALTAEPLYRYRDHDGARLTLRPQQEQLRDLRKLLAKHGIAPDEQDRLAAEKARWYGVPCHVAMNNPDWYLKPKSAEALLGDQLQTLIDGVGAPLIRAEKISLDHAARVGRTSLRLEFGDGRVLKGRYLESAKQAEKLWALAPAVTDLPLSRVLAQRGNAVLEEWVEGIVLDRYRAENGTIDADIVEQAGELMGRLAVTAHTNPAIDSRPRGLTSILEKFDGCLAMLEDAGLVDSDMARQLARLARDNAPERLATGLVHLDVRPSNLVLTPDGLYLIDNESLEVNPLDFDLARTWYLWRMDQTEQARFLRGYARHRDPLAFIRHEVFWVILTLTYGAIYLLRTGQPTEACVSTLIAIASGELPSPWM